MQFTVNVASAISTARYNALLLDGDKLVGLDEKLREEGCSIRRASSRAAAIEALPGIDLVILASSVPEEDVLDIMAKATDATVLVVGASPDLALVQIKQQLEMIDLKRKMNRSASPSLSIPSPTSGVVQRRSAPLPKEATPDALDALVEAAEGLVPMHKFQRVYVDYALRRFGGNKVHTAAALGIDRRTIQRWARARAEQRPVAEGATTTTTTSS